MPQTFDLAFYADTQLDDDEVREREKMRQIAATRDDARERERLRKMRNFAFKGGML